MNRFFKSFTFAFKGLVDLFSNHPNARVHALATVMVISLGWWLGISRIEWVAVVVCIALVIALEAINSAIEYLTDLVSPDFHPLAGKVKDMASGGVLFAAMGAAVVGLLIFVPKLLLLLER